MNILEKPVRTLMDRQISLLFYFFERMLRYFRVLHTQPSLLDQP